MKNNLVKISTLVLSMSLIFTTPNVKAYDVQNVNLETTTSFLSKQAPYLADECAKNVIDRLMTYVVENPSFYGVNRDITLNDYTLGEAYTFFNMYDTYNNVDCYNYPIIINGDVKLILSVTENENNEWTASIAKNEADFLSSLAYKNYEDVIMYTYDGTLYAETEDTKTIVSNLYDSASTLSNNNEYLNYNSYDEKAEMYEHSFVSDNIKSNDSFINKSYNEIKTIIEDSNVYLEEVNPFHDLLVDNMNRIQSEQKYGYTPGFAVNTQYGKLLDTLNYTVTQNGYNLCWAACAASSINYRNGYKKYSAEQIVDKLSIGYNAGGGLDDTKMALNTYGDQTYNTSTSTLSFDQIKNTIGSKKPIVIGALAPSVGMGHMILLVGYSNTDNTVFFYNPGTGTGGNSTTYYKNVLGNNVSFDFTYGGYTWKWEQTVY